MNAQTERRWAVGPSGRIEVAFDAAMDPLAPGQVKGHAKGLALICHPHPQHGGTMDNKVVQTLARAWTQVGWHAVRFNFRGVGGSEGAWDEGRGEVEDARAVLQSSLDAWPSALQGPVPIAIAGFSFGGFVAAQLVADWGLQANPSPHRVQHVVLVGPATRNFPVPTVPPHTLVIHGEQDDVVPLAATLDWARPQALPVVVVPGGGHFFHGQLPLLKALVLRHLQGVGVAPEGTR